MIKALILSMKDFINIFDRLNYKDVIMISLTKQQLNMTAAPIFLGGFFGVVNF